MSLGPLIQALRPRQWTKNGVVLAALVFALGDTTQGLGGPGLGDLLQRALLAATLFCLASSAVYLVNDVRDADLDRAHPVKKLRPVAAGRVSPGQAVGTALFLLVIALSAAFVMDHDFFLVLGGYLLLQAAYTLLLKQVALLDVFIIATGFVLRALAGAVVIHVRISPWLLICTFLLALFLALCKRRHELVAAQTRAPGTTTRHSLRQYDEQLLNALIPLVGSSTLVCYSIYTLWPETVEKFGTSNLAFTIPLVAYGLFRYLDLAYRHEQAERPEQILLTDPPILATVALYGAAVLFILLGQ